MGKPEVSLAIDIGPSSQSRETRRSRVSSPSAAKTRAEAASPGAPSTRFLRDGVESGAPSTRFLRDGVASPVAFELCSLAKMFLDQFHNHRPAAFVCREGLGP